MMREANRLLLLNYMREYGPISHATIAHVTGLSATIVSTIDGIMRIVAKSQRKEKRMKNKGCFRRLALSMIGLLIFTTTLSITLGTTSVARAAAPAVKIMPLGDSITGLPGPGCWRALLWNHLQSTGYTNINFVGTLNTSNACGVPSYDGDNEGHSGYLATDIANQKLLPGWLSATNPDIVMMHLGTNDIWHDNLAPNTILAAYSTLVAQMRANNPHMRILVAQIIPMKASTCSNCAQGVINLNAAIPGWASSITTAQSPVVVVDQWTGFDASADTSDGVHPNSTTGVQKIASKWYSPLTDQINALNGSGGGTSYYKLVNHNSGQVLDMSGGSTANGGVAVQWPYSGGTNQQWQEVSVNGGYKLVNRNSGKVLDDPAYSKTPGTRIDQWSDTNGSNQWWNLVSAGNGYYYLVNQSSGLYADVAGASTANGASVVLWSSNGGANQQWQLVAV
jgi:lysophospholipase L1-like esterase